MSSSNPFYFGYYPGDRPLYKRPDVGRPQPYVNLDWTGVNAFFAGMEKDLDLPTWLKDRIVSDAKSALKAQVRGSQVSPEYLDLYGEELIEDMPGAYGVSVSLNPQDWLKDPGKQAYNTVKDIVTDAWDWDDLEVKHRRKMWRKLLEDSVPAGPGLVPTYTRLGLKGLRGGLQSYGQKFTEPFGVASLNPFAVNNINAFVDQEFFRPSGALGADGKPAFISAGFERRPLYNNVIGKIDSFQMNVKNIVKRESTYDDIVLTFATDMSTDLQNQIAASGVATAEDWLVLRGTIAPKDLAKEINTFNTKVTLAKAIGNTNKVLSSDKGNIENSINMFLTTGDASQVAGVADRLKGLVDSAPGSLGSARTAIESFRTNSVSPDHGFSATERKFYERLLKDYERRLDKLETFIKPGGLFEKLGDPSISQARRLAIATQARRALQETRDAGIFSTGMGGGDMMTRGLNRRIVRDIEATIRKDYRGVFRDLTSRDPDGISAGAKFQHLVPFMDFQRRSASIDQFLNSLEKQNLVTAIFWTRFKNKFEIYTPAYWITQGLNRVHHFGLVINDTFSDDVSIRFGFKKLGITINENSSIGSLFLNKFKLNIDGAKLKFWGGNHFEVIEGLGKWWKAGDLNDDQLKFLFTLSSARLQHLDLLSADYNTLLDLGGGKALPFRNADEFTAFNQKLLKFRQWLELNKDRLGITDAQLADPEFMKKMFEALHKRSGHPDYMGTLTQKFLGPLQKLFIKVNEFQTALFSFTIKGVKVFAPLEAFLSLRNVGVDFMVNILEKVLVGLLGTVTSGVGLLLYKILSPIIGVIGRYLTKWTYNFVSALFTGDFSKVFKEFGKATDYIVKLASYIAFGFVAVFVMIFYGMANIAGNQAPSNPSIGGTVGAGGFGGGPGPPGGSFGTGVGCSTLGAFPLPVGSNGFNRYHWDGYRPVDLFAPQGVDVFAPFDGTAYIYDSSGGYAIIFHPDDLCQPGAYYTHLDGPSRVSGSVSVGQVVGKNSNSGSACKPCISAACDSSDPTCPQPGSDDPGAPLCDGTNGGVCRCDQTRAGICSGAYHVHFASDTDGEFYSEFLNLCSVKTLSDWGFTPQNGLQQMCCNPARPGYPGCQQADNQ